MMESVENRHQEIDIKRSKFPFCVVWTPIPILTWLFPFLGHMGIALSTGVIRDFAGSFYVSEDDMAFGKPTKYWQLDASKVAGGIAAWDRGVTEASDEYKKHTHNLFVDNCHSHVALALNKMSYPGKRQWNMMSLCWEMLIRGKHTGLTGWLKTWLPFLIWVILILGFTIGRDAVF
uniref:EOG090X0GY7 n=1 Tax=Lynceus sp. MCZ IZ 141354 TaxID=1930659 RepID=A0A9N6ZHG6_9CRUS|nr:EOG090X0GY7 [Lynceus sp. MCZ IZ 141354]